MALWLLLLLALPALDPAWAETVQVFPVQDNTLFQDPAGALSSGAGPHLFSGNNGNGNTRRAVIAFDLAPHIAISARVDSVSLRLSVSSAPNDTPQQITLHRLLAAWGEGTSVSSGGAGATSTDNDATWLHSFYPGQFWSSAGGDFAPTASATAVVGISGEQFWSSTEMVADVQQWLETPATNDGWLLKGNESNTSTVRRFDSRESGTLDNRPLLIIHYTTSATSVAPTDWGVLKKRYMHVLGGRP